MWLGVKFGFSVDKVASAESSICTVAMFLQVKYRQLHCSIHALNCSVWHRCPNRINGLLSCDLQNIIHHLDLKTEIHVFVEVELGVEFTNIFDRLRISIHYPDNPTLHVLLNRLNLVTFTEAIIITVDIYKTCRTDQI